MPYCSQCGVEVEEYIDVCPLCSTPIHKSKVIIDKKNLKFPDKPVIDKKTGILRFLAWEIIGVALLTAFLIILLTNLITDLNITWARYPLASIFTVWLLATFPLLLTKNPLLIALFSVTTIMIFIAFIDIIDNWTVDWYYYIALPIALLLIIVTGLVIMLSIKVKKKGVNIAAFILFGTGTIAVGLDVIINYALSNFIILSWSLFVIIPILLTGIFLLYIHYRLMRIRDVKKWFQL
ncbi:MAG: hypothetical protein JW822_10805 [Spirochaetales bacterium]|nr:hypothetical protein [Spirochaetales bacterium]